MFNKALIFNLLLFLLFCQNPSNLSASDNPDLVIIDPGHGGKDPGTIGLNGSKEKDINLSIALKFGQLIQNSYPYIKIIFTRSADNFVDVKERTEKANTLKAKLFISIHCNHKKEEETEKNGFEIYVLNRDRFPEAIEMTVNSLHNYNQFGNDETAKFIFSSFAQNAYFKYSSRFAESLQFNIINLTGLASRGIMQSGFWVLLGSSMPSVLIECGYLSDKNDESYLSSEEGQSNFANALLTAFSQYIMFCRIR